MQKDDFIKLKVKFAQSDVSGKIVLYTQTPDLNAGQYKELLRMFPYERIGELEEALRGL